MAILFSQADGSDQHYDTYEEFEQAMILMKRLNGEEVPQDLLDEVKEKCGGKEGVEGSTYTINVDTSLLTEKLDEEIAKLKRAEPLGKDANGEDLFEGDYVTGAEDSQYNITSPNAICEVESDSVVKLIQTTDEIYESRYEGESFAHIDLKDFVKLSDNLDEAKAKFAEIDGDKEPKFKVGDRVKVVNNLSGGHPEGTVGVIERVNCDDGTFDYEVDSEQGSPYDYTMYHGEIELEHSEETSTEFRTGDIIKVTVPFRDHFGDWVTGGAVYEYDENYGELEEAFVGLVYLGDNIDKLQLVCRKEDRKDIEL